MAEKIDSSTLYELLRKIVEELGFGYLKSITLEAENTQVSVITR